MQRGGKKVNVEKRYFLEHGDNMIFDKYNEFVMQHRNVKYSISFKNLPPASAIHKWVGAQCAGNSLYGIPNDMNAILKYTDNAVSYLGNVGDSFFKWTGGCIWGKELYAFSRTSNSLLKMSIDNERIEYIRLKEKYVREHHYGGICTKEGKVYQPPRDSNHILVWNLKTGTAKKIYIYSENKNLRYCGSILHPNGYAYFLPEIGEKVIKLNTETEEWSFIGENINAMVFDAKVAIDGAIYGYSAYCSGILKISVESDDVEIIHCKINSGAYGTKLGVNGHLYSIPGDGNDVWDFDPITSSINRIYKFSNGCKARYAGGACDRRGNIYAVPARANNLLCLKSSIDNIEIPDDVWKEFFSDCY